MKKFDKRGNTKARERRTFGDSKRKNCAENTAEEEKSTRKQDRGFDTPFNDFSWYNANPSLTNSVARIPFPYRPGDFDIPAGAEYSITASGVSSTNNIQLSIPGVLAVNWMPSLGYSDDNQSPVSIAAAQLYSKVRAAYAGELEADAPDLLIYLCALDSIFSYVASLKRIYRVISTYGPDNRLIPRAALLALGIPAAYVDTLSKYKTQFYGLINELVAMVNVFRCPAVFPMFNRHYWLNDNVYMDANTMNSQMYTFVQKNFWKFQVGGAHNDATTQVGQLEAKSVPTKLQDGEDNYCETLFNFGVSLCQALSSYSTNYTISGYFKRTFEGKPEFYVDELKENEQLAPLYVEAVLAQIENIATVPLYDGSFINQDPSTNAVISADVVNIPVGKFDTLKPMLNLRSQEPSVEEVIEATRLQAYVDFEYLATQAPQDGTIYNVPVIAGTEVPVSLVLYARTDVSGNPTSYSVQQIGTSSVAAAALELSSFDWAPRVVMYSSNQQSSYVMWDMHNVTSLSLADVKSINKVCLYSELSSFNTL